MPAIEIEDNDLKIELSGAERVWALSRGFRIPLATVTNVHIEDDVRKDIGWRFAGTGTCNFAAGTFFAKGKRQFVYINVKKQTALVIDIHGEKIQRAILGVDGGRPAAEALVARISPS
jgi:hypothetical protein